MSDLSDIVGFLKNEQRVPRDSEPLIRPSEIHDEQCHPGTRELAAKWYGAELLKRKTLTPDENKYLLAEITKHLREERENEKNHR